MTNMLDFDNLVSQLKFQLCNYIHFQTNIVEKGMNPFIPQLWVK